MSCQRLKEAGGWCGVASSKCHEQLRPTSNSSIRQVYLALLTAVVVVFVASDKQLAALERQLNDEVLCMHFCSRL